MTLACSALSNMALACSAFRVIPIPLSLASICGSSAIFQSFDVGQRGAVMTGGASALTIVVLLSYISAPSCRSTVVYPALASFDMLIRDVCMPGMMFISRAPSRRSCFNIIFLVAVAVRRSGNMKVFVDLSPVSSNSSASSSGPAPEVAPESNIPVFLVFLFAIFRAQCAATLLRLLSPACADKIISTLVGISSRSSSSSFSSCASTRQDSGDQ